MLVENLEYLKSEYIYKNFSLYIEFIKDLPAWMNPKDAFLVADWENFWQFVKSYKLDAPIETTTVREFFTSL